MKILVLYIIILLYPAVSSFAYDRSGNYSFFDKDSNRDGYAVERDESNVIDLYNKDWSRRGYIRKEGDRYTIYDKEWRREGYVKKRNTKARQYK